MTNRCNKPLFLVNAIIFLLCITLMTACAENPGQEVVVSKNDGAFNAAIAQTAPASVIVGEGKETVEFAFTDSFQSTDGKVDFTFQIQEEIPSGPMPVVEVVPHFLTGEEAKQAAHTLFGDVQMWEARPYFAETYSKKEIQEKINRWSAYATDDAITALYGQPKANGANAVRIYVENYTRMLETAPETIAQDPCHWEYQESWKYAYTPEQVAAENIALSTDDEINAEILADGIPYLFAALTRDESDYQYNTLSAGPNYGPNPINIDNQILRAKVCQVAKPTHEQLDAVKKKAQKILTDMGIGTWFIDRCEVEETVRGEVVEYDIVIQAVPVFSGVRAVRQPQIGNIKSTNPYAQNYNLTDVTFHYAPGGTLLSFKMTSPVDELQVVNSCPAVLTMEELMERAKNHMQLSDVYTYGAEAEENLSYKIYINHMDYGLSRIKVPDMDYNYYYVPSVIFYGTVEVTDKTTGDLFFYLENQALLNLNAVDGSVIQLSNT